MVLILLRKLFVSACLISSSYAYTLPVDDFLANTKEDIVFKEHTLFITRNYVNPDGIFKSGLHVNGQSPGPCIQGDENDWIRVTVNNNLPVAITIHFHGILQRGTPWADGVSGVTQNPIFPGESYVYEFQVKDQYGFTWYHAHHRGYLTDGVYGPMNFITSPKRERPYHLITNDTLDIETLLELEKDPIPLIGDDSFKWDMDTIISRMFDYGVDPLCIQSILINGKGRKVCHDPGVFERLRNKNGTPHNVKNGEFDSWGCMKMENGYTNATDVLGLEVPGYYETCDLTFTEQFEFHSNTDWYYFNLLNAGGQFTKAFSIDGHQLWVVAIDGIFVNPQLAHQIILPVGSRVTIVVKAKKGKFPIRFAAALTPQFIEGVGYLVNHMEDGSRNETQPTIFQDLDGRLTLENHISIWPKDTVPFDQNVKYKLGTLPADHTFRMHLNRTGMITFSMFPDGELLPLTFEHDTPLLYNFSRQSYGKWALRDNIKSGDIVDIIINNSNAMGHPIHLHGHLFYLLSHDNSNPFIHNSVEDAVQHGYTEFNDNPTLFDITYIPPRGHSVIRFVADNPGIWLIHCHNLGHLLGGMGAVIFEDEESLNQLMTSRTIS